MRHIRQGIKKPFTFFFYCTWIVVAMAAHEENFLLLTFPVQSTYQESRCNVSFENIFREKVEVISSNRQGQPNYNYFSFFVCRNPVLVISISWSSGILSPLPGVKVGFNLRVQLETVSPGKIEAWMEKWKSPAGSSTARDLKWVATFFPSVSRTPCFRYLCLY